MSGETEKDVSAWTIDSLKELMVRLQAESDRRYEQRFEAQEKAVLKAEAAAEARFDSVNEFRAELSDRSATQVTRVEFDAKFDALSDRVSENASRLELLLGRSHGLNAGWGYLVGAVGFVATIVALVVGFR